MVAVEIVNTAAILIAYMCIMTAAILWLSAKASVGALVRVATAWARTPANSPLATNSIATNNRPLPRNTVAKNRSSRSPIRLRTTPMNHRNAMPAKATSCGTKASFA
jgi:hypothetical protein